MSSKITYGCANALMVLTAESMGYNVSSLAKEQSAILLEGGNINPIYMGMLDLEATELHNLVRKDGRTEEANTIAKQIASV